MSKEKDFVKMSIYTSGNVLNVVVTEYENFDGIFRQFIDDISKIGSTNSQITMLNLRDYFDIKDKDTDYFLFRKPDAVCLSSCSTTEKKPLLETAKINN